VCGLRLPAAVSDTLYGLPSDFHSAVNMVADIKKLLFFFYLYEKNVLPTGFFHQNHKIL